jgi:Bacterial PH domain
VANSDSRREAIEVAARPLRELQKAEHDEIAAAQRALSEAEREHAKAIEQAQHDLRTATEASALAAYGHRVILFHDRISTPAGNHALTSSVKAVVEEPPAERRALRRHLTLRIEEPGWTETVRFPRRDERAVRELARAIEATAADVDVLLAERGIEAATAERDLTAGRAQRQGVRETRPLVHRLGELCEGDEDVLDMAPAISAGHDGVLVATDRRLLFVSLRRTLSFPYRKTYTVALKAKRFGSRLIVSTPDGKAAFSGLSRLHAEEIATLVRERTPGQAAAR